MRYLHGLACFEWGSLRWQRLNISSTQRRGTHLASFVTCPTCKSTFFLLVIRWTASLPRPWQWERQSERWVVWQSCDYVWHNVTVLAMKKYFMIYDRTMTTIHRFTIVRTKVMTARYAGAYCQIEGAHSPMHACYRCDICPVLNRSLSKNKLYTMVKNKRKSCSCMIKPVNCIFTICLCICFVNDQRSFLLVYTIVLSAFFDITWETAEQLTSRTFWRMQCVGVLEFVIVMWHHRNRNMISS